MNDYDCVLGIYVCVCVCVCFVMIHSITLVLNATRSVIGIDVE